MFDTNVYQRRRKNPYLSPGIIGFMKSMAVNKQTHEHSQQLTEKNDYPEIKLSICHRPSVSSSFWYTLEWVDLDGDKHMVDSQDLDLLGWRALQVHENVQNEMLVNKHGSDKQSRGMIHPDCTHCVKCGRRNYRNEKGDQWCSNIYCPY